MFDINRLLIPLIAMWMRETNMEPTKASAITIAERLRPCLAAGPLQFSTEELPYVGAAFQAIEELLNKAPQTAQPRGMEALLNG